LNVTKEVNIDVLKYGLPNDPKKLHEALYMQTNIEKLINLIENIKQKSEPLKTLEEFIKK
jgi:hypothetical protein